VLKTDTRKVEMQKLPVPTPGPGQALLKMRLSTICGSDIHIVDELPIPPGTPMGHEAVGEVVDAGEGVTSFQARATAWSPRASSAAAPARVAKKAICNCARATRRR